MSDEYNLESLFIGLLQKDATLAAIPITHHDNDDAAESVRISVSAVKGEQVLEGPGGFAYELTISLKSNDVDADQLNDLAARVDAAMESPAFTDDDLTNFSELIIDDQITGDRPVDADTRSRVRVYPIQAVTA